MNLGKNLTCNKCKKQDCLCKERQADGSWKPIIKKEKQTGKYKKWCGCGFMNGKRVHTCQPSPSLSKEKTMCDCRGNLNIMNPNEPLCPTCGKSNPSYVEPEKKSGEQLAYEKGFKFGKEVMDTDKMIKLALAEYKQKLIDWLEKEIYGGKYNIGVKKGMVKVLRHIQELDEVEAVIKDL